MDQNVVEPLSKQTAQLLAPLRLDEKDYLLIAMSANGKLRMSAVALVERDTTQTTLAQRYIVNGREMQEHWHGPSHAAHVFFRRLPECTWNLRAMVHEVAATEFTAAVILSSWPENRRVLIDEASRAFLTDAAAAFADGKTRALAAARFKAEGVVPTLTGGAVRGVPGLPLAPYQRAAVELCTGAEAYALFMDRGTGKTACAIERICAESRMLAAGKLQGGVESRSGKKMLRVLILCPNQVRLNWSREIERFASVPGKVTVMRGDIAVRVRRIVDAIAPSEKCMFSVLIAGYDSAARTITHLAAIPWDLVITDEGHFYKDPRTSRWAAMLQLRDASARRMSLTGTPIGNSPMDLWSQLEFLRPGLSGFSTFKAFKAFHGVWERTGGPQAIGVQKLIGLKDIPLLQERLMRCSFSVSKEEAQLGLPDKVRSVVEIQMTPTQAEFYNKLQSELALEIEDKLSGNVNEVTVQNILTQLLRLAQITSGYITYDARLDEDGNVKTPKRLHAIGPNNPKIDALLELLTSEDRDPLGKTIVWCTWVFNIEQICNALAARGIKHASYYGATSMADRDAAVDAFNNDPEFKVLVANAQTAGEGLNLVGYDIRSPEGSNTYCDLEIFFSSNWSAIQRAQAEDRAHRRGTRMPVQIVDLIVPGTIDEEILERVMMKRDMADTVADLRHVVRAVLSAHSASSD